jgi:hypothetical protein
VHRIDLTLHETTQLLALPFYPRAGRETVAGWLPEGATLETFDDEHPGVLVLGIVHPGSTLEAHTEILNSVMYEAQLAGYRLAADGQVAKLGDRAVAWLLRGAGIGGLGGATTENRDVAGFAALVGALVGGVLGSQVETVEPIFQVRLLPSGGWELAAIPRRRLGPGQPGLEPA